MPADLRRFAKIKGNEQYKTNNTNSQPNLYSTTPKSHHNSNTLQQHHNHIKSNEIKSNFRQFRSKKWSISDVFGNSQASKHRLHHFSTMIIEHDKDDKSSVGLVVIITTTMHTTFQPHNNHNTTMDAHNILHSNYSTTIKRHNSTNLQ